MFSGLPCKTHIAGKALSTIRKRMHQMTKVFQWRESTEFDEEPLFPITAHWVNLYVRHLLHTFAKPSVFQGVLELVNFLHHVLGVEVSQDAIRAPWIRGVIRRVNQTRPPRKQARPLKVCELEVLEQVLSSEKFCLQDRYAAGVFLFATYSRARVGDLKCIGKCITDVTQRPDGTHYGYIEMHS